MWSYSVLIGQDKYTKMNVFVYVLLKWWSQSNFWTLAIRYADQLSSEFKENKSEIIYESQRRNIFSNAFFTACIEYYKLSLKKSNVKKNIIL